MNLSGTHALLGACVFILSAAVAVMLQSMRSYRKRMSASGCFHKSDIIELTWNLAPVAVFLLLAAPAIVDTVQAPGANKLQKDTSLRPGSFQSKK